jgi:hypothetical protein
MRLEKLVVVDRERSELGFHVKEDMMIGIVFHFLCFCNAVDVLVLL